MPVKDLEIPGDVSIPSPPGVAVRILEVVRSEDFSATSLAQAVSLDPALTAKILRAANSSYYSLGEPVGSIQKAVDVLGTEALTGLALSFALVKGFRRHTIDGFDHDLFWRRAVTAAVSADLLARERRSGVRDIFVKALLMDIGVIVLYLAKPERYLQVLDRKRVSGAPVTEAESEVFGFDHQEIGARMLRHWGLPESIWEPIARHHAPEEAGADFAEDARLLRAADRVSAVYHGGRLDGKLDAVRELLGAGEKDGSFEAHLDLVAKKASEILRVFEIPDGRMRPYSEILEEARREIEKLGLSPEQLALLYIQEKKRTDELCKRLKNANDRLRSVSISDELTGLQNRRFFDRMMEKEVDRSDRYERPLSLLLIDIDYFDKINDAYGHPQGDVVLRSFSQALRDSVRLSDSVARFGADEFAVALPETDLEGAVVVADRLRKLAADLEIRSAPHTIKITVSLGVTGTPGGDRRITRRTLSAAAGDALAYSRQNGGNRFAVARPN